MTSPKYDESEVEYLHRMNKVLRLWLLYNCFSIPIEFLPLVPINRLSTLEASTLEDPWNRARQSAQPRCASCSSPFTVDAAPLAPAFLKNWSNSKQGEQPPRTHRKLAVKDDNYLASRRRRNPSSQHSSQQRGYIKIKIKINRSISRTLSSTHLNSQDRTRFCSRANAMWSKTCTTNFFFFFFSDLSQNSCRSHQVGNVLDLLVVARLRWVPLPPLAKQMR